MKGYFSLVLHAHLPFVRHPGSEFFLEEDWLFEAISESYLPLLHILGQLTLQKTNFRLTLSISPTLVTMLHDPILQERTLRYLNNSIDLAEKEMDRTSSMPDFNKLAEMYHKRLVRNRDLYQTCGLDPVKGFKKIRDSGMMEIITCPATHPFLPLMAQNPNAVKAQIAVSMNQYQKVFGGEPSGLWLPECGYFQGLDRILESFGIKYFFLDAHGILNGEPRPKFGAFAPIRSPGGPFALGRDMVSSKQVWSSFCGYPGDSVYRDFYRDIGFDLEQDYIRPHVQPNGQRKFTGIKYHRVTGSEKKEVYQRDEALKKVDEHAADFLKKLGAQNKKAFELNKRAPLAVSLFDAELFGHWWFEGPEWLSLFFRKAAKQKKLVLVTPTEYFDLAPEIQKVAPSVSSWGEGGYAGVWLNEKNDWLCRSLHSAADRITRLVSLNKDCGKEVERILNQACKELLLAQASDWAFMINTGSFSEYAENRVRGHLDRFDRLCLGVESGEMDLNWLKETEELDNIFPGMDFRVFCD